MIRQRRAVLQSHVLALEEAGIDGSTAEALRSSNDALKAYGRSISVAKVGLFSFPSMECIKTVSLG